MANDNNWTPLHRAALCGQVEVVQRLLNKGADMNAQSHDRNTPLHIASIAGKLEVVRLLLDHGADVDILGENNLTPLWMAEKRGHDDIVKLLSERGLTGRWLQLAMLRRGRVGIPI